MKNREEIHEKIDELLGLLSIHNNRLSLHEEKISHLDIDVLRKHCIDLYDNINRLALEGRLAKSIGSPEKVTEIIPEKKEEVKVQEHAQVKEEKKVEQATVTKEVEKQVEQKPKKPKLKKKEEEEMISLFERYNSKPIDDISKAISVSKRFEFQNNFFEGDAKEYKGFIESLDLAGDREAAFEIYHDFKNRLKWDNEELKDELKSLLYRKYQA